MLYSWLFTSALILKYVSMLHVCVYIHTHTQWGVSLTDGHLGGLNTSAALNTLFTLFVHTWEYIHGRTF